MEKNDLGSEVMRANQSRGMERFALFCLLALAFLLPLFFIPAISLPLQFSKALVLSVFVLAAFCIWLVARLKDGEFVLPSSPMMLSLGVLVALFALSSLLSGSIGASFVGQGFEVGTTVNMLIVSLLAFLVPVLFRGKEQIFWSYLAFLASFSLIAFFHLLRVVLGPDFLSVGIFTDIISNTIGKWNDLGVFFGVGALLSLVTIEFLSLGRFIKVLLYLSLFVSLVFLAIVNFSTVWFTLGLFSLIFFVYLISFRREALPPEALAGTSSGDRPLRRIPIASLVVLLISVIFILAGGTIGREISEALHIQQIEARPSWQATFDVTRQTLIKDPLLGAGPNQFTSEWLRHKPDGINTSVFWNVDFSYGVGLVPTFLVTTGILGILAWLAFFLVFLHAGFKAILSEFTDTFSQYLITSSFLVSLFLWIFSIFYIPSLTIFALTFLFTGLFIAALMQQKMAPTISVSFVRDPRTGFVSVLILILLLIGSVSLGYFLIQKYVANAFFQRGVIAINSEGSIDMGEKQIMRAAAMSPLDVYYRFLSEITLMRINTVLNQDAKTVSADTIRSQFQKLLGDALGQARQAVKLNPRNYENYVSLGRVYEAVVPLGLEGAYESATGAYMDALKQNPRSPAIYLAMARLEAAKKDYTKARENIAKALQEKGNYTEAIFLLSQIEVAEGNIKAAIKSVEAASSIDPTNPSIFFQLGLLRFNDKAFPGAASAFKQAIDLSPQYANAKYFLGLSFDKLGRTAEAIQQFTDLKASNPGNSEVDLILRNLKAGRDPFAEARPPVDDKPEKRSTLPVNESAKKSGATEE